MRPPICFRRANNGHCRGQADRYKTKAPPVVPFDHFTDPLWREDAVVGLCERHAMRLEALTRVEIRRAS